MKLISNGLFLVLSLTAIDAARASFIVTSPATQTVVPGTSGTSVIGINPTTSGNIKALVPETIYVTQGADTWLVPGAVGGTLIPPTAVANPFSAWSSTFEPAGGGSKVTSFTSQTPFEDVVSWTVAGNAKPGDYTFNVSIHYGSSILGSFASLGTFNVDVVAAPEPGQVMAGVVLLGAGGLVFATRRWLKKSSVSTGRP